MCIFASVYVYVPCGSQERVSSPGVVDSCKPHCKLWELDAGPLQEQSALNPSHCLLGWAFYAPLPAVVVPVAVAYCRHPACHWTDKKYLRRAKK